MLLMWGVEPFMIEFGEDSESTIKAAFERLYTGRIEWASPGDWMVVITNILVGEHIIDSIQLRQVE
jgi:pyruvate kinase